MEFKRKRYSHPYLNVAPLVDVVFLLLLFFMLTSHLVQEPAVRVKLPESKTSSKSERSVPTVYITSKGDIYYQGKRVLLNKLRAKIQASIKTMEHKSIRIKADRDVKLSLLIRVIDEIKLAGIRDFGIVTVRPK